MTDKFKFNSKYTRQKERIAPFLDRIREVWEKYPDLRFMQLIFIITKYPQDCFYMEEDEFLKLLEEWERL